MIRSKLPDVGTTIFTVMSKMANDYGAINLSQGFPDFQIDSNLKNLVAEAVNEGHNQYAPMPGLPMLLERIAESLNYTYGWEGIPTENITVTAGATEGLFSVITAIIEPGDEVIVLEPAYDCYIPAIELNGGKAVPVSLDPKDFSLDREKLKSVLNSHTKAIMINTPHNPTGSILSDDDLEFIIEYVEENQLLLISDEVYHRIIFDQAPHRSMIMADRIKDRTITVFSFGKTFHATGWKIGYIVAERSLTAEIRKIHQFVTFAVSSPMQWAIAEFLKAPANYENLSDFYEEKRDRFQELIRDSRFKILPCNGTYFQLLSYEDISDENDFEFASKLTQEYKLASIPVSVFYSDKQQNRHLRFCFAKNDETLQKAADILCRI